MELLSLGIVHEDGAWFGVLVDSQDRLVTSAFSSRNDLSKHLSYVARKIAQAELQVVSHRYANSMVELFKGRLISEQVALNPELVTPFQKRVYRILKEIPRGRVTTYGAIAASIGSGPRAVGTAVASNPWSLFVPCHRVVPFSLAVGQYSMNGRPDGEGSAMKRQLLIREGVVFDKDRILPYSVWRPTVAEG